MSNLLCKWTLGLIHVLSVSNLRMSIWTQDVGRVYSCHMIETVQVFEHSRGCPWPPCFANCFNDISVNLGHFSLNQELRKYGHNHNIQKGTTLWAIAIFVMHIGHTHLNHYPANFVIEKWKYVCLKWDIVWYHDWNICGSHKNALASFELSL